MALDPTFHGLTEAEAKRLRELGGGSTPPPPPSPSLPARSSADMYVLCSICSTF